MGGGAPLSSSPGGPRATNTPGPGCTPWGLRSVSWGSCRFRRPGPARGGAGGRVLPFGAPFPRDLLPRPRAEVTELLGAGGSHPLLLFFFFKRRPAVTCGDPTFLAHGSGGEADGSRARLSGLTCPGHELALRPGRPAPACTWAPCPGGHGCAGHAGHTPRAPGRPPHAKGCTPPRGTSPPSPAKGSPRGVQVGCMGAPRDAPAPRTQSRPCNALTVTGGPAVRLWRGDSSWLVALAGIWGCRSPNGGARGGRAPCLPRGPRSGVCPAPRSQHGPS